MHIAQKGTPRLRAATAGGGIVEILDGDDRLLLSAGSSIDELARRRRALRARAALLESGADSAVLEETQARVHVRVLSCADGGPQRLMLTVTPKRPRRLEGLTERQQEVAELAALGMTVSEVGSCLGVSANTVRAHLKAVYATFGISNRVELHRALHEGWE
jgi:DNA-binding NarL/FixJ family response regulator